MDPLPSHRAWSPVAAYVRTQSEAISSLGTAVRVGEDDAVHRLRVACRRLWSVLRTFEPYVDPTLAASLRAELRWLAGGLGPARDTEVMAARLRASLAAVPPTLVIGPVVDRLGATFSAEERSARDAATETLDHPRYAALPGLMEEVQRSSPVSGVDREGLQACAYRSVLRLDRRLATAATAPPGDARTAALHAARKAGKRARYAAEAIGGEEGRPLVDALKRLQDVLGAHNDAVNAQHVVRTIARAADAAGESTFTYGLLHANEQKAANEALATLPAAERGIGRKAVRSWLVP